MLVLRKNLLVLTRYTKNVYKNITVSNKTRLIHCHQSILLQFPSNFSSQSVDKISIENVETSEDFNKNQEESPGTFSLDDITKGDKELEHKLKVIMLETEVLRQDGKQVPPDEFMTPQIWENLLNLPSRASRTKHLEFLFKTSKKRENRLAKKIEKHKEYQEGLAAVREERPKNLSIEEHALNYGLLFNNIFIRIYDPTINQFYNSRLIKAMQFGQKLVIDCGYDQNMTRRENYNTAKQLMLLFSENRNNDDPFDIYYTNMHKGRDMETMLQKYIPTMYEKEFPMNIYEKSYLDLFPKQKLVYLTPHCREEMDTFDHDAVYIVGAIVDKVNHEPLSLAKAKREGITMKKFPLDRYLQWGSGSGKSLTLNQCVAILLDLKDTGDWKYALRHVPRRKLMDTTSNENKFKISNNPKPFFTQKNKPFFTQKKNTWKPKNSNNSKINVSSFFNE